MLTLTPENFDVSLGSYDSRQFTAAGDTTPASVFHVGLTLLRQCCPCSEADIYGHTR